MSKITASELPTLIRYFCEHPFYEEMKNDLPYPAVISQEVEIGIMRREDKLAVAWGESKLHDFALCYDPDNVSVQGQLWEQAHKEVINLQHHWVLGYRRIPVLQANIRAMIKHVVNKGDWVGYLGGQRVDETPWGRYSLFGLLSAVLDYLETVEYNIHKNFNYLEGFKLKEDRLWRYVECVQCDLYQQQGWAVSYRTYTTMCGRCQIRFLDMKRKINEKKEKEWQKFATPMDQIYFP